MTPPATSKGPAPNVSEGATIAPRQSVVLVMFASAREAAGTGSLELEASTIADVHAIARERFGTHFAQVLEGCRTWVNGEPADSDHVLQEGDEVAILPPVSGGSDGSDVRRL